ncbi:MULTISPECIES: hypothetical protein [Pseudanabaena]|uniref:Uncharacterized protein n=2 Tax=Pseudanabaena TaxID=1152 RepID=L8MZ64_9CYAN|nr:MULTISPECIES: hypothetical protein [Pseudanabaena]ELS31765.1 hypothetical protein Pse7429DRAFT_3277 [Pseudanabaena biceps PCC 7429]MDG3495988.1 hypothetical protein [Pseudanabaena catenata USMAC16]
MQSDAFPTPPIYSHYFQPRLLLHDLEPQPQDSQNDVDCLLDEIEILIADCSIEESQSFWLATDCIKIKHHVIESMQKIESLFLDLAKASTTNPALIAAVSDSLLYTGNSSANDRGMEIPNFLKHRLG